MARTTTTTATYTPAHAAFFAATGALALVVEDMDGGWAVITRSGQVIPAASEAEADHILTLAGEREVRESVR